MTFDVDALIERCYRRELLSEREIRLICEACKDILSAEGNVRSVEAPVTVVGDVHGSVLVVDASFSLNLRVSLASNHLRSLIRLVSQFYDVLELFRISGPPPSTSYVFLGDYVDRGYYSVETITLLTCLKVRWPERMCLVRGNHESRAVTMVGSPVQRGPGGRGA